MSRPKRTTSVCKTYIISSDSETDDDHNNKRLQNNRKRPLHNESDNEYEEDIKKERKVSRKQKLQDEIVTTKQEKGKKRTRTIKPIATSVNQNLTKKSNKLLKLDDQVSNNIPNIVKPDSKIFPINTNPHKYLIKPWTEPELLSELQNINFEISNNIIKLFKDDNTIPFIIRYRQDLVGNNMTPERLRDIKQTYSHILNIKTKTETIVKTLHKQNILTDDIQQHLLCAKSLDELEHLYAPYKQASKTTLCERAKSLGLLPISEDILYGKLNEFNLNKLVNKTVDGLENVDKVTDGIKNIISYQISKNPRVLDKIRKLQKFHHIILQSTLIKPKSDGDDNKNKKNVDIQKYQNYFNFKNNVAYVKSHQILAINRGENLKMAIRYNSLIGLHMVLPLCRILRQTVIAAGIF